LHNPVPCCLNCFSPIFSLATHSVVISQRYRIFHSVCPALQEGLCSAAVLFGCYSKFSFQFKTCFGFSDRAVGVLVLPGLRCFLWLVDLISGNAMQLLHWVQCEPGAFLSVLVYTAYVCCVKVTLLHVCMLLLKKYFHYCSSESCIGCYPFRNLFAVWLYWVRCALRSALLQDLWVL